MSITFRMKKIETVEVTIRVVIGDQQGQFKGDAVVRSKAEMKQLSEQLTNGEIADDGELVRRLYKGFRGIGDPEQENVELEGDAAIDYVVNGPLSTYLNGAVVKAYFEHYGEALAKNLPTRRSR